MINVNDLENYEFTNRMCGEHGRGVNKFIDAKVKGKRIRYVVSDQGEIVLDTPSLKSAVDAYNDI